MCVTLRGAAAAAAPAAHAPENATPVTASKERASDASSAVMDASSAMLAARPAGLVPRLRFIAFSVVFVVLGFFITVANIPSMLAYPLVHALHPLPYNFYLVVSRPWGLLQTLLFFPVRLIDHDRMPATGGCVIVANHQSNLDFMALWHLKRRCIIMSKREVLYLPFLGTPWSILCGHIMVNRKNKDSGRLAIEEGARLAKQGYAVFVFPEGTRRSGYGGQVQEAKMGAFKMAKMAGVPVVPLTIRGSNHIMPNHDKANITVMHRGEVEVYVHRPLDPRDFELGELKQATMMLLQSKLRTHD